jgi:hypothetical protein
MPVSPDCFRFSMVDIVESVLLERHLYQVGYGSSSPLADVGFHVQPFRVSLIGSENNVLNHNAKTISYCVQDSLYGVCVLSRCERLPLRLEI